MGAAYLQYAFVVVDTLFDLIHHLLVEPLI